MTNCSNQFTLFPFSINLLIRSPVSQTTRWNELEAKTAAFEESQNPMNLSMDKEDKEDKKDESNTAEDEPSWIQCSPKGNFYSTDPKMQKVQIH